MKKTIYGIIAATAFAAPLSASTVVDGSCVSVASSAGCLFSGNISSNPNGGSNGYLSAQNAYNFYNNSHPSANPDILLNIIASSDDAGFAGLLTGSGTSAGTWTLGGYLVNYVAVKASNGFVLYELGAPSSTGSWNTNGIPHNNNTHGLSHLVFFGSRVTSVPEPATWAMMLLGFGAVGFSARRQRRTQNFMHAV
jgi:hypothetical protein